MKILITGGAGFIGAHLSHALLKRGDQVVIYDDFNDFLYKPSLKEDRLKILLADQQPAVVRADIMDQKKLDRAFTKYQPDYVIHLAAYANPRVSLDAEEIYTEVNVRGTLNVLKAATQHQVKKIIFAGSSSVYNDEQIPFKESSYPLLPRSPYGASKAAAEIYCAMWHELHQMPIIVLRFFSVYGPWGRPDMAPIIFGANIITGRDILLNRSQRQRDFTYIDDIVKGTITALDNQNIKFDVINLGRGEPVGLGDLILALESAAGTTAKIIERDAPAGEMRITYADITKAKKLLNYAPQVSIDDGARKLVSWLRDYYIPAEK